MMSKEAFAEQVISGSGAYEHQLFSAQGDMSYGRLAFLTLQATFQTMLICLMGYGAARKGWLDKPGQKCLSQLNVMVFTPCLIFSKMGSSLSLSRLPDLAIIPVLFVLTTGVSYVCGRTLSRWFHLKSAENNFVTAMAVFGNSNSLPVSLTVSLAQTLPFLKWDDIPGDTNDGVTSRGLLYLLIFQQLGQMVRWSWGYNTLLAKPIDQAASEQLEELEEMFDSEEEVETTTESARLRARYPHSRNVAVAYPSPDAATPREADPGTQTPIPPATPRGFLTALAHEVWQFMNMPLWSMLAALIVASIEPAKNALFLDQTSFLHQTFGRAIQNVGAVAIPLILVVLGSNLAPQPDDTPPSPNFKKIVFASLFSRMVLPALVLLPAITFAVKYLGISILDDPIFLVSSFILTVSPPAIQLAQITQINGVYEAEMAGVLFWGYVVLTPPSSILIVVLALQVLRWTGVAS